MKFGDPGGFEEAGEVRAHDQKRVTFTVKGKFLTSRVVAGKRSGLEKEVSECVACCHDSAGCVALVADPYLSVREEIFW